MRLAGRWGQKSIDITMYILRIALLKAHAMQRRWLYHQLINDRVVLFRLHQVDDSHALFLIDKDFELFHQSHTYLSDIELLSVRPQRNARTPLPIVHVHSSNR